MLDEIEKRDFHDYMRIKDRIRAIGVFEFIGIPLLLFLVFTLPATLSYLHVSWVNSFIWEDVTLPDIAISTIPLILWTVYQLTYGYRDGDIEYFFRGGHIRVFIEDADFFVPHYLVLRMIEMASSQFDLLDQSSSDLLEGLEIISKHDKPTMNHVSADVIYDDHSETLYVHAPYLLNFSVMSRGIRQHMVHKINPNLSRNERELWAKRRGLHLPPKHF